MISPFRSLADKFTNSNRRAVILDSFPKRSGVISFHISNAMWLGGACFVAVLVGVLIPKAPSLPALGIPMVLMVMVLALLVSLLFRNQDVVTRQSVMKWTIGAYFVHLCLGEIIWSSSTLTGYFGGDALTYNYGAIALRQHWQGLGPMPGLPAGKDGFFYLLAYLYQIFGNQAGAGMAVDAAFAAAMIPLLYDATNQLFGKKAARYIPALCLFMPGFLIWSSQLLRESGIYFGIALGVNAAVRLTKRMSLGAVSALAFSVILVFVWRASVGALMAGGFLIALTLQRKAKNTFATFLIAGIAGVAVLGLGIGYSGFHLLATTSLAQINDVRSGSATGAASGFLPSSDIATGKHAIFYIPIGMPLFMFGPMPWQIGGGRQLFSIPDVLVWWSLLPSLWRGWKASKRICGRVTSIFVMPALTNAIGLSLIIANFGTAVRERMQVIAFLLPLIALGLSLRKKSSSGSELVLYDHQGRPITDDLPKDSDSG